MVTPETTVYKINPDCQGTHIIQSEMDEIVKKYEFACGVVDEQRGIIKVLKDALKRISELPLQKERKVFDTVSSVLDPEIGIPISEMKLIDEVRVEDEKAFITFHLSTPMCPPFFAVKIGIDIHESALEVEGIKKAEVKVKGHYQEESINQNISDEIAKIEPKT